MFLSMFYMITLCFLIRLYKDSFEWRKEFENEKKKEDN